MRTIHLDSAPATIDRDGFRDLLRRAIADPRVRRGAPAVVIVTAPVQRAGVLGRIDLPYGFSYASAAETTEGTGVAARLDPIAPSAVDALFARAVHVTVGEQVPPRLYGGIAFGRVAPDDPAWGDFGAGCFTLPRWAHRVGPAGETLSVALAPADALEPVEAELDAIFALPRPHAPLPPLRSVSHLPYTVWAAHVDHIRAAIGAGEFEKLVAARSSTVSFDAPIDDLAVLARLAADQPDCNRFLFRRPTGSFVGASPEHLLVKTGTALLTHALAGSRDPRAPTRLGSAKDRLEHDLVVRQITAALEPLAREVRFEPRRERRIRDIVHLETPIHATVHDGVHPLDLLSALHPTPAVGGLPRDEAVRWIERHEPGERGWYSGVVGWIDARGDAELAVAIRSALLQGRRARVYAGAGIVEASDPSAEYEETALKMRPLLRALGIDP